MKHDIDTLFHTFIQLGKVISARHPYSYEDRATTQLQFMALSYLLENTGCATGELASTLHLSKSSATQLIERLVRSDFVVRKNDEHDRRITRLFLTQKGERELSTLRAMMHAEIEKIFSVLPEQDIAELIRINTRLIEALREENV